VQENLLTEKKFQQRFDLDSSLERHTKLQESSGNPFAVLRASLVKLSPEGGSLVKPISDAGYVIW
jgi:hypothetical protein